MRLRRAICGFWVAAIVGVAATASAHSAPRPALVDRWSGSMTGRFRQWQDARAVSRVRHPARMTGRAAASATLLHTRDGYGIRVILSPSYRASRSTEQAYVDFLGSLLHGRELGHLAGLEIETPREVEASCGSGAIACYSMATHMMVVPGQPPFPGAPVAYVVAHEYAHHIAAYRLNAMGSAELLGPQQWAQYEHVCRGVGSGVLKPGAEASAAYFENPGEAWAEAYAQYRFPHVEPWRFDRRLAPDSRGSSAAIRAAVLHPWRGTRRTMRARGLLSAAADVIRSGAVAALDGSVQIAVSAPPGLVYRVSLYAGTRELASRRATGRRGFNLTACSERRPLRVLVTRLGGAGEVALRMTAPIAS